MSTLREKRNRLISIIIPAHNEEESLGDTLASIRGALDGLTKYEVIVVDHLSDDGTKEVARKAGVKVFSAPAESVAELRNIGVEKSEGDILVFLDSDVTVGEGWGNRLLVVADEIGSGKRFITGNWCLTPEEGSWIERKWFAARRINPSHLGTGHMIVGRSVFEECGGFDDELTTGEDFDFCRRAQGKGCEIRIDVDLKAIHHGYPKTLSDFFRREVWHGAGDFSSLSTALRSKVAMASVLFLVCHALLFVGLVFRLAWVSLFSGGGILGIVLATVTHKFGRQRRNVSWIAVFLLSYVYLIARGCSAAVKMNRSWRGR